MYSKWSTFFFYIRFSVRLRALSKGRAGTLANPSVKINILEHID